MSKEICTERDALAKPRGGQAVCREPIADKTIVSLQFCCEVVRKQAARQNNNYGTLVRANAQQVVCRMAQSTFTKTAFLDILLLVRNASYDD